MEQLNKVELIGIVGRAVKTPVGDLTMVRFSVATNYSYLAKDGCAVIETTWHNCSAFTDKVKDADKLEKGSKVHLSGRIRNQRYMDANGEERTFTDIFVNELEYLD